MKRKFIVWMLISFWLCVIAFPVQAQHRNLRVTSLQEGDGIVDTSRNDSLELGRTAYQEGRFFEAKEYWEQAEQYHQKQDQLVKQAIALNNLALANIQLGHYSGAEQWLNQAKTLLQSIEAQSTRSRIEAQTFSAEAQFYSAQGLYRPALKALERAEQQYEQLDETASVLAQILRNQLNQAEMLRLSGLYPQALERLESVSTQLDDQPDTLLKAAALRQLGTLLDQIAGRSKTGICQDAQDCLEQSLKAARQTAASTELALSLISLSSVTQDWNKAEPYLKEAIALPIPPEIKLQARVHLIQRLTNQLLNPPRPTATNRHRLAQQQQQMQDPKGRFQQQFQAEVDQALIAFQSLPPNRSKFRLQADVSSQLLTLMKQGKSNISIGILEKLLSQLQTEAQSLRDTQFESYALGYRGQLAEYRLSQATVPIARRRYLTEAKHLTNEALQYSENQNLSFLSYQWLWQRGRLAQIEREGLSESTQARQRNQLLGEALTSYEASVNQLNLLRGDLININRQNRLSFRERIKPIYQEFIDLLIEADEKNLPNQVGQNFALEQRKGRSFTSYLDKAIKVADSLQVAELTNFFRSDCLLASEIRVEDIDPKAAIIYPIIFDDHVTVIVGLPNSRVQVAQKDEIAQQKRREKGKGKVTQAANSEDRWTHHRTDINITQFDQSLSTYRDLVSARGSTCKQDGFDETDQDSTRSCSRTAGREVQAGGADSPLAAREEIEQLQEELYDVLIRPFETEFETSGVETLLFLSSGQLQNIPMAVLYDRERDEYLIDRYAIATSPSLQLLDSRPLAPRNVRAILGGLTVDRGGFDPLEFVQPEIEQIQAQTPDSQVLLGEDFTQANLETKVSQLSFPIVHLATHGVFGSTLEDTYVVTADDYLNANELSALLQGKGLGNDQPIELLVLSACETAKGDELAALGLSGIAVRSGARSTVGSLWLVDDESTAILMQRFYKELTDGSTSRAEAVRRAQLYLKDSPEFDKGDPYYWAAFVLVGNWL